MMSVVQTTALDSNSGMSAARGGRVRPVGHQGAGVRAARPSGRDRSGLAGVARFLVRADRASAAACANVCPVAVPGVMMGLEVSTAQCRGCRGGADRGRLVEMRLVKVV